MAMEAPGNGADPYGNSSPRSAASDVGVGGGNGDGNGDSTIPRRGLGLGVLQEISALNILRFPLSLALEYSGIVPARSSRGGAGESGVTVSPAPLSPHSPDSPPRRVLPEPCAAGASGDGDSAEVSIRIIGGGGSGGGQGGGGSLRMPALLDDQPGLRNGAAAAAEREPLVPPSPTAARPGVSRLQSFGGAGSGGGGESEDSSYQSYDIQQVARWIEQILPFSILLLVVFIRQHLIGFILTIWISVVMYKSNDIVRRQTALKGERKSYVLVGIFITFMLHVVGIYWWFRNDDILYPLVMLPPKAIPPFWHAIFIILVNDTLMRQAAMALKCLVLIYYKNGRGYNFRRQGQILTLIEYTLLLYRVLLPTPVWYRFFLNKENGSLFSSLTTGLYLTFKLTSVVEKVQFFLSAAKALSQREVLYGSHATPEQVNAAGDLCAICQEKIHSPILLRCKHIFCEDCVSEWFERERTCPLCRALVKPPDLRTFGDGSTNLLFQLF